MEQGNCIKRIRWIDVAKGYGIFLIVLGHILTTGTLRRLIFAFHVPLFFILSGLTLNTNIRFKNFLVKKFKSLMIPYFTFSVISIVLFSFMIKLMPSLSEQSGFFNQLFVVLYGNSRPDIMKWNTPLWFLPCLFAVLVVVYVIERSMQYNVGGAAVRLLVIIVSFVAGVLFETNVDVRLPMQMESGIFMIGFVEIGVILSKCDFSEQVKKISAFMLISIGLLVIGSLVSHINGFAEVRTYYYGKNGFLFIITSVTMSMAFLLIAMLFENSKIWKVIGVNSMVVLLLHKFPIVFFQSICPGVKSLLSKPTTMSGTFMAILVAILVIALCNMAGYFIKKVCPESLGKKRKKMEKKLC